MVVDDIVVVGARPLFMTDYIACGKVVPERIADDRRGHRARLRRDRHRARRRRDGRASRAHGGPTTTTSRAPRSARSRRMRVLGPERVQHGDVVVAIASSGLHSNGFSLVRRIVTRRGLALHRPRRRVRRPGRRRAARADPALHAPAAAAARRSARTPCTPSATSPAAASPPTSRACCRAARGSSSTARPGARSRCSACSPSGAASRSTRPRAPGTSASA